MDDYLREKSFVEDSMFDYYSDVELGRFELMIGVVGHYVPIQQLYYDYILSLHAEHLLEL